MLARSSLTAAVYGAVDAGGAPERAAGADTALDEVIERLVRDGDLTRDVASVDASRHLRFPAVPGMHQVEVIVYRPMVVVGPRRSARMPAQRMLDPRFLRTTDVGGHLRSIGHLGWEASAAARAAYREDKQRFGLVGPAELPAGYTYVSPHPRRQSTRPLDRRGDRFDRAVRTLRGSCHASGMPRLVFAAPSCLEAGRISPEDEWFSVVAKIWARMGIRLVLIRSGLSRGGRSGRIANSTRRLRSWNRH